MTPIVAVVLVALNLGLIFLLLTAPVGVRTIRLTRTVSANRSRLWNALWPLGAEASWSGEFLRAEALHGEPGLARLQLCWEGRDGRPIEKMLRLSEVVPGERFQMRVDDDLALHPVVLGRLSRRDRHRGFPRGKPCHACGGRPLSRLRLSRPALFRHAARAGTPQGMGRDRRQDRRACSSGR